MDRDPDLALFVKSSPGSEVDEIYITGPKLEIIERLSPDGWSDSCAPSGEGVLLLAGTGDSWAHLGISKQSRDSS